MPDEPQRRQLFNGRDLDGWQMASPGLAENNYQTNSAISPDSSCVLIRGYIFSLCATSATRRPSARAWPRSSSLTAP